MSRLLYEEPLSRFAIQKSGLMLLTCVPTFVLLYIVVGEVLCDLSNLYCDMVPRPDIFDILIFTPIIALFSFSLVRLAFARKRVRIFEDRITVGLPRKIFPGLSVVLHGDVIRKADIRAARLEVLTKDGEEYKIKVKFFGHFGSSGDWRLLLFYKNGETRGWAWDQLLQGDKAGKAKARRAIERFLSGIPTEASAPQG